MQPVGESPAVVPRLRRVSAACALFAALAVVASMFVSLYRGSLALDGEPAAVIEAHSWGTDVEFSAPSGPKMGYPLIFAVVLLLGAAVLSRLTRTARAAGVVTAAGTAFLAGVVWSIGMQLASLVGSLREVEALDDEVVVEWDVGPGLGLLLVAVGFSVAATVAAFLPPRRPAEPDDPYQADVTTPRYGFPVPEPGS